jgi:hypothetical protein
MACKKKKVSARRSLGRKRTMDLRNMEQVFQFLDGLIFPILLFGKLRGARFVNVLFFVRERESAKETLEKSGTPLGRRERDSSSFFHLAIPQ